MKEQDEPPKWDRDGLVQFILAISTVILVLTVIIAFVLTNNVVLGATTIVGIAVTAVFGYYFPKNKGRK